MKHEIKETEMIKEIALSVLIFILWILSLHFWLDIYSWLINDGTKAVWGEPTAASAMLVFVVCYALIGYLLVQKPFFHQNIRK